MKQIDLVNYPDRLSVQSERWRLLRYLVVVLFIASALLYAVYLVVDSERQQQLEVEKRRAAEHLSSMRGQIEQRLQANILALRALRPEILWQDTPDRVRVQRIMDEFLGSDLDIMHLALAPDLTVRFIYPVEGNQSLLGFNYRLATEQYSGILRAIAAKDMVVSGPLQLVQGQSALLARMPIFHDDRRLWGVATLAIDHNHLLEQVEFYRHPNYEFALRHLNLASLDQDVAQEPAFAGNNDVFTNDPILTEVQFPRGRWQLAAFPRDGSWVATNVDFWLHWAIGISLTAVILMAFLMLVFTQHRLRGAITTIAYQARYDGLTDLPNRNFFQEQLGAAVRSALRHEQKFALLVLDLDHLREINDVLGHDVGNALLQRVAERIRTSIREDDLLARIGGDEFAIVLRDLNDPSEAEIRATAIMNDLLHTLDIEHNHINMTTSTGIAMFPHDGQEVQQLIKHAELAMYAAKQAGAMSVHFFDEQLRQSTERDINLHHQIIKGIEAEQFEVHYQPVIETETGLLTRCEALIRWTHPERGAISPAEFIPIAEKTGAIIGLGAFVLSQVLRDWKKMHAAGLDLSIALNRSPREFNDRQAASHWLNMIAAADVPTNRLMFEITESMLMCNKERQFANLRKLRDAGVSLAIDDFGTGYSSLNYLRSYPIDVIKIDRSFLHNVPEQSQQTALVEVLIRIAHTLNMKVVAEGVETAEQVGFLQRQRCHLQQGFFYGRAMPLNQFITFTQNFNRDVLNRNAETSAENEVGASR